MQKFEQRSIREFYPQKIRIFAPRNYEEQDQIHLAANFRLQQLPENLFEIQDCYLEK